MCKQKKVMQENKCEKIDFNFLRKKYFNDIVLLEERIKLFVLNVEMWTINLEKFRLHARKYDYKHHSWENAKKWFDDYTFESNKRMSFFEEMTYVRLFKGDLINIDQCWKLLRKIKVFNIEDNLNLKISPQNISSYNKKYRILRIYLDNLKINEIIDEEYEFSKFINVVNELLKIRNKLAHSYSYGPSFIDNQKNIEEDYLPYLEKLKEILLIFNLTHIDSNGKYMTGPRNIEILRQGMLDKYIESHFNKNKLCPNEVIELKYIAP